MEKLLPENIWFKTAKKALKNSKLWLDEANHLLFERKSYGHSCALSIYSLEETIKSIICFFVAAGIMKPKHHLVNEFFIDVLAYNYYSKKDEQILYAILKKKIELFPKSPTAYEALAYAYYKNDKKEQAIINFEKVLELEPDNRNAIVMIQRIKKSW